MRNVLEVSRVTNLFHLMNKQVGTLLEGWNEALERGERMEVSRKSQYTMYPNGHMTGHCRFDHEFTPQEISLQIDNF